MAQQNIAGLAAMIALAFVLLALAACANSEHIASTGPVMIAPLPPEPGTGEFHGAGIGDDALRSRLLAD